MPIEETLDLIRKRRTIRRFTEEDVSREQVETLLEMAMCAPNRLDRQPWHFVVIRDKALQKQIDWMLIYQTPKLSTNALSYNIEMNLDFLHTQRVDVDMMIWSKQIGY